MQLKKFISNVVIIILPTSILAVGAWYYSAQQIPVYRSNVRLLVIQKQASSFDPTSAIRASEKVAEKLAQVIPTEDFLMQLLSNGNPTTTKDLLMDISAKRDTWRGMVATSAAGGFINLNITHPQPEQAEAIAAQSAAILVHHADLWHGGGEDTIVKIVDSPITSSEPVRPKTNTNIIIGALTGLILSSAFVFYRYYLFNKEANSDL